MAQAVKNLFYSILCLNSGFAFADSIWDIINQSEYLEQLTSIEVPDNAVAALPIEVSLAVLTSLQRGDEIEIKISDDISINFPITDILSFPNGDTGWTASNYSIKGLQTISMTSGRNYFLASLVTPENSYNVIAKKRVGFESYIGWIFVETQQKFEFRKRNAIKENKKYLN